MKTFSELMKSSSLKRITTTHSSPFVHSYFKDDSSNLHECFIDKNTKELSVSSLGGGEGSLKGFVKIPESNLVYIDGEIRENLVTYPYSESTITKSGVTFTDNKDGSITAVGTATADMWFGLRNNSLGDPNIIYSNNAPWKVNDILQANYHVNGDIKGTLGITCGYKTLTSSGNQGYIFYRTNLFDMKNGSLMVTDKKVQSINPLDKIDMVITGYIYIAKDCVINATITPIIAKKDSFGDLILRPFWRALKTTDMSFTNSGITYTLLDDNSVLVNGTTGDSESAFELVNPYAQVNRQKLQVNHKYRLSEGRVAKGYHNNPYLQLVRADESKGTFNYTYNTANEDTFEWVQKESNLVSYGVRIVVGKNRTVNNVIIRPSLIDITDETN